MSLFHTLGHDTHDLLESNLLGGVNAGHREDNSRGRKQREDEDEDEVAKLDEPESDPLLLEHAGQVSAARAIPPGAVPVNLVVEDE
ncbi:uncharacterized protein J3R85_003848 [Psidium guajava]|nr:uncharacterized protein J3R85_003848 [Psidium guajava]